MASFMFAIDDFQLADVFVDWLGFSSGFAFGIGDDSLGPIATSLEVCHSLIWGSYLADGLGLRNAYDGVDTSSCETT